MITIMSSFIKELTNPKTGKKQKAFCIDDYFAENIYGYFFRKDGEDASLDNFHNITNGEHDIFKGEDI